MVIEKATVTVWKPKEIKSYSFHVNAYWITIADKDGNEKFNRNPNSSEWMDTKHKKITDALSSLEKALTEAIE